MEKRTENYYEAIDTTDPSRQQRALVYRLVSRPSSSFKNVVWSGRLTKKWHTLEVEISMLSIPCQIARAF